MLIVLVLVLVDSLIAIIVLPLDNARASVVTIPNKQNTGSTRNVCIYMQHIIFQS